MEGRSSSLLGRGARAAYARNACRPRCLEVSIVDPRDGGSPGRLPAAESSSPRGSAPAPIPSSARSMPLIDGATTAAGRYDLHVEIAAGGMATVHIGRLLGPVGFARTVAIKRLHPQYAKDPEFVSGFLDEARLAARVQHPNVVATIDVVATDGELFLIMDYVRGESLSKILRVLRKRGQFCPPRIAAAIMCGFLHGLHAAHEAKNERGEPLGLVHRDVSPQNVLVGADGIARLLDFGVAKATGRMQVTSKGQVKGKLAYMAPEQVRGTVTPQSDVYSASAVLWEALTCHRLFQNVTWQNVAQVIAEREIAPPSAIVP